MSELPHAVRRQRLAIEVASPELARALQPRLSDWNRRCLLPVIDRVCGELAGEGRWLRLPRLEIDLGTLAVGRFAQEAPRRLETELRRALREALDRLDGEAAGERDTAGRLQDQADAPGELLEHQLLHGTVPHWAAQQAGVSLEARVGEHLDRAPAELFARLARLGSNPRVLERLALQLDVGTRARLLPGLAPEPAARLLDLAGEGEERQVWVGLDRTDALALQAFSAALARLPAPYRPQPESRVRHTVFAEARRAAGSRGLSDGAWRRMLRQLFAWPLSEPVYRLLSTEAAAWAGSGRQLVAHAAAFQSAVATAAGPARRQDRNTALEGRVGAYLRGEPGAPVPAPEEIRAFLARLLARRRPRGGDLLPAAALPRLARRLAPHRYREILDAAGTLAAAWRATAPRAVADGQAWQELLLGFLAHTPGGQLSRGRLVAAFFAHAAARLRTAVSPAARRSAAGRRLLEEAVRRARAGGLLGLAALLDRHRRLLLVAFAPARPRRQPPAPRPGPEEPSEDLLYVDNAGLVLAGPFLPHLFAALELLESGADGRGRLRDVFAASRAVHLLQALVDGRSDAPEPRLALNKILCGLPVAAPVERAITPTARELELAGELLCSLLAHWPALANTSVAGLRETFLERPGRLERGRDGWKLRVQRKTVDVLVDEVPWSLSIVYHPWMPEPLAVTW